MKLNENLTVKDFIERAEKVYQDVFSGLGHPRGNICEEGMRYLIKKGKNKPLKTIWKTCNRPMWLLWAWNIMDGFKRSDAVEYKAVEIGISNFGSNDRISKVDADKIRENFTIDWATPKLKKDEAFIYIHQTTDGKLTSPFIDHGFYQLDGWNDISKNVYQNYAFRNLTDAKTSATGLLGNIKVFKVKVKGIGPYHGSLEHRELRHNPIHIDAFKIIERVG